MREVAGVYGRTVSAVGQMRSLVTAVRSASGTGIWHGASGDAFRELLEDFPAQIEACETSYATARDAMNWWAGRIEDHQASADRGLEQARAADQDLRAAQVALDAALSNASRTSSALERIERDAIRYRNTLPPAGVSVPTASQIASARRASSQAASAQASAARAASDAQSRLDVASRLVAEAAASYEADAATTISRVERASEQALPENSLWEKVYRSDAWHVIVTIATVVVIVAAVAAFVLTGPIAAIVAAAAAMAGVLLALNDVMAWRAGDKAGWEALLSVAFTVIPGGVLLRASKGSLSVIARLGKVMAPRATAAATSALRAGIGAVGNGLLRVRRLTQPTVNRINHAIIDASGRGLSTRGEQFMGRWYLRDYAGRPGFTMDGDIDVPSYATQPDEAFFWSGRTPVPGSQPIGGEIVSAEIATGRGGVTLESMMADRGIALPKWDFEVPATKGAWGDASAAYAEQVSGDVRAVIGQHLRETNVWEGIELPALRENPRVTRITVIDPATLVENVIHTRP